MQKKKTILQKLESRWHSKDFPSFKFYILNLGLYIIFASVLLYFLIKLEHYWMKLIIFSFAVVVYRIFIYSFVFVYIVILFYLFTLGKEGFDKNNNFSKHKKYYFVRLIFIAIILGCIFGSIVQAYSYEGKDSLSADLYRKIGPENNLDSDFWGILNLGDEETTIVIEKFLYDQESIYNKEVVTNFIIKKTNSNPHIEILNSSSIDKIEVFRYDYNYSNNSYFLCDKAKIYPPKEESNTEVIINGINVVINLTNEIFKSNEGPRYYQIVIYPKNKYKFHPTNNVVIYAIFGGDWIINWPFYFDVKYSDSKGIYDPIGGGMRIPGPENSDNFYTRYSIYLYNKNSERFLLILSIISSALLGSLVGQMVQFKDIRKITKIQKKKKTKSKSKK